MGISDERKNRRRKEILKVAAALFIKKGFDGTSFNEIAERSRASKETLYAWFGSKTEILATLVRENGDRLRQAIETQVTGGTPDEVLYVIAREVLRGISRSPELSLFGAAMSGAQRFPELRNLVAEALDGGPLVAYLEICRATGLMAFDDSRRTAMVLASMMGGDYAVRLSTGLIKSISEEEIEAHARFVTKMFLKSVAPA